MSIEISTDGVTVWVNSEEGNIGRYWNGHADILFQSAGLRETRIKTWKAFVDMMKVYHHVTIPDSFEPNDHRSELRSIIL